MQDTQSTKLPGIVPGNGHSLAGQQPAKIPAVQHSTHEPDLDSIGLVDESDSSSYEKKIKAFGVTGPVQSKQWKRPPLKTGTGAVRVRTFHGKLSTQGMEYLDNAINDWLEEHPEVEVKFVTSSVGVFEGKIRESALILNVWY